MTEAICHCFGRRPKIWLCHRQLLVHGHSISHFNVEFPAVCLGHSAAIFVTHGSLQLQNCIEALSKYGLKLYVQISI